jgi:hypothetical protein
MKRILFSIFILLSSLPLLAQTKPVRNIGREQTVPLSSAVGIPVIVDSANKKVGRLINPAEIATNAQLSLKASQTSVSDTALQLRSDLATKSEVQDIPALAAFKDKIIAERSISIGFNNDFSSKTIAQITGNLATSPNYATDGWYKFTFYTYKSGSVINSLNDYSSTETLPITGLPANSGSNTPLYFTTVTPQNFNGTTAMRNGDYLMLLIINRQMVTWYTGTNDLATKKAVEMLRDSLSNKASQAALDTEASARVAGDALRPTFTNLSDSLSGVWKTPPSITTATPSPIVPKTISMISTDNAYYNAAYSTNKTMEIGFNTDAAFASTTQDYSALNISTNHWFLGYKANRRYTGSNSFFTKGTFFGGFYANGILSISGNNIVAFGRKDSLQQKSCLLVTDYPQNKELTFGNGVGMVFNYRRVGIWTGTGLQFYNQLN